MTHPSSTTTTTPTTTAAPSIIGLDLGDRLTHLCALDGDRQVVARDKFRTTPDEVRRVFGERPRSRIILEAGSQSPWMSGLLRELGHDVQVADPRRIALIAKGHRKTDRRDAEVLARMGLGMPELLGEVHHRTPQAQAEVAILRSRDLLVSLRTSSVQHVRGTCKAAGVRLPSCSAASFHRRVSESIPELLMPALRHVLATLEQLERSIRELDQELERVASQHPEVAVLRQVNGVGLITALSFALTIGDPSRFARSRDVGSWFGLAPRVQASGDKDPQLPISKTGDTYVRRILVQSAHYILGPFGKDSDLRRFGMRLIQRGGKGAKRRAAVAVARKLAVLLHSLWVSGEEYEPLRNADRVESQASA